MTQISPLLQHHFYNNFNIGYRLYGRSVQAKRTHMTTSYINIKSNSIKSPFVALYIVYRPIQAQYNLREYTIFSNNKEQNIIPLITLKELLSLFILFHSKQGITSSVRVQNIHYCYWMKIKFLFLSMQNEETGG